MRLEVDFSALWAAANMIGGAPVQFRVDLRGDDLRPIDVELRKGLAVDDLEKVKSVSGLLTVEGRQILLYIPDHGWRIHEALEEGIKGKRFHVADCKTLKQMREKGRYDRYVATNNLSGQFDVHGRDQNTHQDITGKAALMVCKNCLDALNYRDYRNGNRSRIHEKFEISAFFKDYSSFFKYYPSEFRQNTSGYSADWQQVSKDLKESRKYTCESCRVYLGSHRNHLHVHHINGVKSNNRKANLKVLCIICHSDEPLHKHLFVSHEERKLITRLRREQQIISHGAWQDATKYCDPALLGVMKICQKGGAKPPEVGLDVQSSDAAVIASLDLAWPSKRVAIAINQADIKAATAEGWKVWQMGEVLENESVFLGLIQ